ncbi:MAG TPA: hypothetical protein VKW09_06135 [bacterium]|nr:hypothetical protein [bacterium]
MDAYGQIIQAFVEEARGWTVLTVAALMPTLWTLTLMLTLARPYMLRTLRKCTVRFGGDVWWLSYVLMRDGVMIVTLAAGFVFLLPHPAHIVEGQELSLPLFGPLATLCLFWALAVKLTEDTDDDPAAYRRMISLLTIGGVLYFISMVFGSEAGDQDWLNPVNKFLATGSNPAWAHAITLIALVGFGATGAYIFTRVLSGIRRGSAENRPAVGSPIAPVHQ